MSPTADWKSNKVEKFLAILRFMLRSRGDGHSRIVIFSAVLITLLVGVVMLAA